MSQDGSPQLPKSSPTPPSSPLSVGVFRMPHQPRSSSRSPASAHGLSPIHPSPGFNHPPPTTTAISNDSHLPSVAPLHLGDRKTHFYDYYDWSLLSSRGGSQLGSRDTTLHSKESVSTTGSLSAPDTRPLDNHSPHLPPPTSAATTTRQKDDPATRERILTQTEIDNRDRDRACQDRVKNKVGTQTLRSDITRNWLDQNHQEGNGSHSPHDKLSPVSYGSYIRPHTGTQPTSTSRDWPVTGHSSPTGPRRSVPAVRSYAPSSPQSTTSHGYLLAETPLEVQGRKRTLRQIKGDPIGKGTYPRVFLELNVTTSEMIAVRKIELPKNARRQKRVLDTLIYESNTLKNLDHPNIVQYLSIEDTEDYLSIFLEYVPGESISNVLRKYGKFDRNVVKSFTAQVVDGLEYLHLRGIFHRDFKADNILVDSLGICKISDFGISKGSVDSIYDYYINATSMQGSIFWMAPEVMYNNGRYGYNAPKIDIWNLGCLVLEMWAGRQPWNQEDVISIIYTLNKSEAPRVPDDVELDSIEDDFRCKCFGINPNDRPTAAELRKHKFLELSPGWKFTGFSVNASSKYQSSEGLEGCMIEDINTKEGQSDFCVDERTSIPTDTTKNAQSNSFMTPIAFNPSPSGATSRSASSDEASSPSELTVKNTWLHPPSLEHSGADGSGGNGGQPSSSKSPVSPSHRKSFFAQNTETRAFRPPPEDIYNHMEDFFPGQDLDKLVVDAAQAGGSSPTLAEQPPPPSFPSPLSFTSPVCPKEGSIREAVYERASNLTTTTRNMLHKRSTKMWGSRVEEAKWIKGDLIGRGTYGQVFLAFNLTPGELIAVKEVELPKTASDRNDSRQKQAIEALISESDTLQNLDHPNIVQYLGIEYTEDYLSIFFEYVPGESIGGIIRKHGKLDRSVVKSFTAQVVDGLEYIHLRGIFHRELKADNILVDPLGICKISGFGISNGSVDGVYDDDACATSMRDSIFWMAPEVLHNDRRGYNAKIDIWSLGCLVLEMWAGRRPWNHEDMFAIMYKLGKSKVAPPVPDDVELDPIEDDFRCKCFEIDPKDRSTATELRKHKFLELSPGWKFTGFNA